MNLHAVVSGAISAINPPTLCTWRQSTGYNTLPDGTRSPNYEDFPNVPVQVQALSYNDLQHLAGLNIQGVRNAVYLNGNIEGVNRSAIKGGDLIVMPDVPNPTTWLVAIVLENWLDWTKCAVTQQNGG